VSGFASQRDTALPAALQPRRSSSYASGCRLPAPCLPPAGCASWGA